MGLLVQEIMMRLYEYLLGDGMMIPICFMFVWVLMRQFVDFFGFLASFLMDRVGKNVFELANGLVWNKNAL